MILSRHQIEEYLKRGYIRVFPEGKRTVGDNGIDVTIHDVIWRQNPKRFLGKYPLFNPGSGEQIKLLWDKETAISYDEVMQRYPGADLAPWPEDTKFIILQPHEQVLGVTYEWVGCYLDTVGYFVTRSTLGRLGWQFCACSNQANVNTCNRVVLEVVNRLEVPNFLPASRHVIQVTFELLTSPVLPEKIPSRQERMDEWKPEHMLKVFYEG